MEEKRFAVSSGNELLDVLHRTELDQLIETLLVPVVEALTPTE
jgi:hypothetical protein